MKKKLRVMTGLSKKTVGIITVLCILFTTSALFGTDLQVPSNYSEPNAGTEGNPFLISNLGNLRWLSETPEAWGSEDVKLYFLQTADIDASDTANWNEGEGFSPIALWMYERTTNSETGEVKINGTANPFFGNYDGNHFAIYNLYINPKYDESTFKYIGFFSVLYNATISNLWLVNFSIKSDYTTGGLAGATNNSTIETCFTSGMVTVGEKAEHVGGLAGVSASTNIQSSGSYVIIDGTDRFGHPEVEDSDFGTLGGLVGSLYRTSQLINSYFNGEIRRIAMFSGGLVGFVASNSVIENCYTTTRVRLHDRIFYSNNYFFCDYQPRILDTSKMRFGGIAGSVLAGSSVLNSFWNKETMGLKNATYHSHTFFWFLDKSLRTAKGITTAQMKKASAYKRRGWDFDTIWGIDPKINGGFPHLK